MPCSTVCLHIFAALVQGIMAAGTLSFLHCWGINIQPLLAVGSIGTGDARATRLPAANATASSASRPNSLLGIWLALHRFPGYP
jgi:hypothetical protein